MVNVLRQPSNTKMVFLFLGVLTVLISMLFITAQFEHQQTIAVAADNVSFDTGQIREGGATITLDSNERFQCVATVEINHYFTDKPDELAAWLIQDCKLPFRTWSGLLHEVTATLLLPVFSLFIYFVASWKYSRPPKWKYVNMAIVLLSGIALYLGWWQYITTGVERIDGELLEIVDEETWLSRMSATCFSIGLGGVIGVFATQGTDYVVKRFGQAGS